MEHLAPVLEVILGICLMFMVYTLRKTDIKIDKTASDLAAHRLEVATVCSIIRVDTSRDFATKLELRDVEKRSVESNREVNIKLDRLIDRLIDNPYCPK